MEKHCVLVQIIMLIARVKCPGLNLVYLNLAVLHSVLKAKDFTPIL